MLKECLFLDGGKYSSGELENGRPYEVTPVEDTTPTEVLGTNKCIFLKMLNDYEMWPYDEAHDVKLNWSMICVSCHRHLYFKLAGQSQENT